MAKLSERAAEAKQDLTSAWDSTREERTLFNVMAAHKRALGSRAESVPKARSRGWWLGCLGLSLATAGVILIVRQTSERRTEVGVAPAGETTLPMRTAVWEALPVGAARLFVEADDGQRVRLRQPIGKVEYEVKPAPERNFSVRAGDVEIRVRGTRFTVESTDSWVEVRVLRGSVDVLESARTTGLRPGEFLRVPTWRGSDPVIGGVPGAGPPITPIPSAPPAQLPAVKTQPTTPVRAPVPAVRARIQSNLPAADSVEPTLQKADQARKSGDLATAATILRGLAARAGRDPRGATIWFTLGRVEAQRGHFEASAKAFDRGWRSHPEDPLAGDALAESAQSLRAANRIDAARAAARLYLDRFPRGGQIHRMRDIMTP